MDRKKTIHLSDAFIQSDLQCIRAIIFFCQYVCFPWELNPQPFALLTQCSTTEPQEQIDGMFDDKQTDGQIHGRMDEHRQIYGWVDGGIEKQNDR